MNLEMTMASEVVLDLEEYAKVIQSTKCDLYARDPGLAKAVAVAQETDPDIGWLDVAVQREKLVRKP